MIHPNFLSTKYGILKRKFFETTLFINTIYIEKDENKLMSLIKSVGYQKLTIQNSLVVKSNPNTQIDFNALAQGFTVDLVGEHLQKLGITNYMIEIGGELKCSGLNADKKPWRIGIDKPSEEIQKEMTSTGKRLTEIITKCP